MNNADDSVKKITYKYECDYCGGFEVEAPALEGLNENPTTVIGLKMIQDGDVDENHKAFTLKCCMWCWKKQFDAILGAKPL